ncbi:hypothetical protein HK102_011350, partial [Quaeritorhiza haematococci]
MTVEETAPPPPYSDVATVSSVSTAADEKTALTKISLDERAYLTSLWENPQNWTFGMFYHCPEDPRLWVPKKQKWAGWTINMASRSEKAKKWKEENAVLRRALEKAGKQK